MRTTSKSAILAKLAVLVLFPLSASAQVGATQSTTPTREPASSVPVQSIPAEEGRYLRVELPTSVVEAVILAETRRAKKETLYTLTYLIGSNLSRTQILPPDLYLKIRGEFDQFMKRSGSRNRKKQCGNLIRSVEGDIRIKKGRSVTQRNEKLICLESKTGLTERDFSRWYSKARDWVMP